MSGIDNYWLPIGDTLFAHTNPIYLLTHGERIIKKEDAEYFVSWIENLESLALEKGEWSNPDDSSLVFNELAEARNFYALLADIATEIEQPGLNSYVPVLSLEQNAPNPFSSGTQIEFSLPVPNWTTSSYVDPEYMTHTSLTIYDVRGSVVRKLVNGPLYPGKHKLYWDGRNDHGILAASGIYFYRLQSGDFSTSRKMLLVR